MPQNMPQTKSVAPAKSAKPAEPNVYEDIQRAYRAEYADKARGGKPMTRREIGLTAVFGLSLLSMTVVGMIPAVPLAAVVTLGAVAIGAMYANFTEDARRNRQVRKLIHADIENGTLTARYERQLTQEAQTKLTALQKLKEKFGKVCNAAPTEQKAAQTPIAAPVKNAPANTPR